MEYEEVLKAHRLELRRGSVVLASLIALRTPGYGYGLLEQLGTAGIEVEANTLYPLLRRLEDQGLLSSDWDTSAKRPRKFYSVSESGTQMITDLTAELHDITTAMNRLTDQEQP